MARDCSMRSSSPIERRSSRFSASRLMLAAYSSLSDSLDGLAAGASPSALEITERTISTSPLQGTNAVEKPARDAKQRLIHEQVVATQVFGAVRLELAPEL